MMNLPKVYEPSKYEADIYALWEKSQAFQPRKAGKSYSVVVPPPNANANLHIGFALTMTLQDIAIRYHRLKGESVLFVPGADHAGFETQAVYEKHLAKEGKSRFDFTREELYKNIWDFVALNRKGFEAQFRSLGGSVDWSRFTFTLDEKIVKRAYQTFKKMWDEGLIYRGERLVNYCTFHGTAFADIEVEYKEEQGKLWQLRYPLTDGSGEIVVATTRPETMLGDTAVAVHADDPRYRDFHGKTVTLPLVGREIPIVTDTEFVDPAFGTGAVKITPAHDPNDFALGERHSLPMITIIDNEGKMNAEAPAAYRGLSVTEARKKIISDLEEQGYLIKIEDYSHSVGHCYKCGTVIQPLLRDQWFVDMQPLAKPALRALEENKITFYPETKKDQLINYLKNLRDWNISRQIAWGIPIPAFQNVDNSDDWIYDERVGQEIIEVDGKTYRRDSDVFDTWFSSSSWPYATLDYPDSEDFKQHYPLSLMETGGEILYPWVSRMIMLGLYVTGEIPFSSVYIHGYVMAEDGSKMSKSLGNVINAPEVIEKYGADALRMGIVAGRAAAVNRGYDPRKVEDARNFANKLWNIARYVEAKAADNGDKVTPVTDADHWILTKLNEAAAGIADDLENYRFAEAYDRLYHFVWDDFADWYIEASKAQENLPLLVYALKSVLVLAHPFAPFVTETIWQTINTDDSLLITSAWPKIKAGNKAKSQDFEAVKTLITEVRATLKNMGLNTGRLEYASTAAIRNNAEVIKRMARLSALHEVESSEGFRLTGIGFDAWLALDSDVARGHLNTLHGKRAAENQVVERLQARLTNANYVDNAPQAVVDQTRQQLLDAKNRLAAIDAEIARFQQ
ncbi:MAG TPA: valine--tRNA ligase [Candidatus Saccharimonadales bacterium]